MNPNQLLEYIIKPTLKALDLWSPAAGMLLMGTCAQESAMGKYIHQLGNGPALGIYQMEPITHFDIWSNFLKYKQGLSDRILDMVPPNMIKKDGSTGVVYGSSMYLMDSLVYATAMTRVHYLRVKSPMPTEDLDEVAAYWKEHYNTPLGKGTVEEFKSNYVKYVG
jgi:hypothetical protein